MVEVVRSKARRLLEERDDVNISFISSKSIPSLFRIQNCKLKLSVSRKRLIKLNKIY